MIRKSRRARCLTVGVLLCLSMLASSLAAAESTPVACSHLADKTSCTICTYESYEVETHHPDQIKLNLFDYWLTEERLNADGSFVDDTDDNETLAGYGAEAGINYDHVADRPHILHFRTGTYSRVTPESEGVKFDGVPSGLVAKKLGSDNFPVAVKKTNVTFPSTENGQNAKAVHDAMPDSESLAYLFDTSDTIGKKAYSDVRGLFQLDSEGYYYYNSMLEGTHTGRTDDIEFVRYGDAYRTANYAYFDETENRFRVYNKYGIFLKERDGVNDTSEFNMHGQFFPFDPPVEVFDISGGSLKPKSLNCNISMFNHYMGLSLEVPFVQSADGKIEYNGNQQDTIFYFSGDDDMWLFLDDVLIGDLGGIHDAFTLEVNFATGEVKHNAKHTANEVAEADRDAAIARTQTTLRKLFTDAGKTDAELDAIFKPGTSILKDGSEHTLRMFYMERGHNASNLGIKFNLKTIPASSIHKQDQDGAALAGAEFSLYPAIKNADGSYKQNGDALFTGTTDNQGNLVLQTENGGITKTIQISQLPGDHFILRETQVPDGYRSAGDMHLMKYNLKSRGVALLSDPDSPTGSKWSTGSYAAAGLTTTATSSVFRRDGVQVVSDNTLTSGTMFAVVLKRVNPSNSADLTDHRNWRPVYGDAKNGYHLVDVDNPDSTDEYNKAISTALLNNPYIFSLNSETPNRYEVQIDHLPGDILQYLNARPDTEDHSHVQYAVFYGWTNATPSSTVNGRKVFTEGDLAGKQFIRINSDNFERTFTANFMALNTKETFNVLKTDEDGEPLAGVRFSLYTEDQTELNSEGVRVLKSNARARDSDTTDADGLLSFPTSNAASQTLVTGHHYYLAETSAPQGYQPRTDLVHIYVDDSGVYADAGVKNDGVTVKRGVGRIVDTMHEYGVNDNLDVTLHNIYYVPQLSKTAPGADGFASGSWQAQNIQYHLHHKAHTGVEHPEHGFEPAPDHSEIDDAHYVNDEGWSHISIYQCQKDCCVSLSSYPYPNKENLGTRDITNLFTREVTVVISNEQKSADVVFEGQKNLTGRSLRDGEFTFKVTPLDSAPVPQTLFAVNNADGSIDFPAITFRYKDSLNNAASSDAVYSYRIEEVIGSDATIIYDPTYWIVKVSANFEATTGEMKAKVESYTQYDQNGQEIAAPGTFSLAAFNNAFMPPATGDDSALLLWSGMLAACMGWALLLMRKRREN